MILKDRIWLLKINSSLGSWSRQSESARCTVNWIGGWSWHKFIVLCWGVDCATAHVQYRSQLLHLGSTKFQHQICWNFIYFHEKLRILNLCHQLVHCAIVMVPCGCSCKLSLDWHRGKLSTDIFTMSDNTHEPGELGRPPYPCTPQVTFDLGYIYDWSFQW